MIALILERGLFLAIAVIFFISVLVTALMPQDGTQWLCVGVAALPGIGLFVWLIHGVYKEGSWRQ